MPHRDTQPRKTYGKAIALWEVNRLLRTHREEHIAIEEESDSKGNVILCTTETYHTGNTLYYISVIPLYHLLRSRKTKKAAELLLHACDYLMHGAVYPTTATTAATLPGSMRG